LTYIIISRQSKEFILNFDCTDFRLTLSDREDLLQLLKMRFINLCSCKGLRFYGIPNASLKEFKSNKSGFDHEPDKKYRMIEEEIPSQEEFEKPNGNGPAFGGYSEQDPSAFSFENR